MPYLSFDLDALDALPDVARSAGIDESQVAYGLLRLWRHAWRAKSDVVTQAHLSGFFQGDAERVLTALEAFGFVATANNGTVRVRGADRYLRVSASRAKGAAITNEKRWGVKGESDTGATGERQDSVAQASLKRRSSDEGASLKRRSSVALTPSSDQRSPNVTTPPACAREEPLCDRLGAAFRELRGADYSPSPADEQAMSGLLRQANGNEAEIARRYRIGLGRTRFPSVTTWVDLNKHWNACAAPETRQQAPPGKGSKPPANVSSSDWDGVPTGEFPL